jgi:hypothetical protein
MPESLGKRILEEMLQKAEVIQDQYKAKTAYPRMFL